MAPTKKSQNDVEDKRKKEKDRKKKQKLRKIITKEKRRHFQYTEEALAQALNAIRTENMAIREACRKYGVPRATIQDRLSGRMVEKPRKVGPEPLLGFNGEQKIVDWIINLAKCGIPVNKQQLLETVKNIIKDMGKAEKLPEGKGPGQTWYQNFLRRHPEISVREPESINKARESVKESSIRKWFAELESFIAERRLEDMMKDPDRVLNGDETGVSLCPSTGKVLAPKGYKNVYTVKRGNEKENLTVLITMTASGKMCPPLVVFPYVRPPKAVVENMPQGWIIGKTESGWMRSDVFYEYIANDFNSWLDKSKIKRPVILFVDGHKSHMSMALSDFCENNDIVLYALPPNTTHITQPADVSVFKPLKQEWKKTVSDWQSRPENHNSTVTKINFCKVFKEALDKDLTQSIKNGFRKCGLFPFDVEAVDFSKCVKDFQERMKNTSLATSESELTERDFIGAHKVITYIKTNLLRNGVDPAIVCREIELAKNNIKEKRRSTSQTPRHSTEVARPSTPCSLEQSNTDKRTVDNNSTMLEDIPLPEVGSFVSLNEIELIDLSDLNLQHNSERHILMEITTEPNDNFKDQEPSSSPTGSITNNSKIVTTAQVHSDTTLKNNAFSTPISKNKTGVLPFNDNDIEIMIVNEDETEKENVANQEISVDPFEKHLTFTDKPTNTKNKTKNITKIPSAISAQKWREYYESKENEKQKITEEKNKRKTERDQKRIKLVELKEREKQKRIEEKNKKKMEREQKNLKTTAKKQKNAEEKRLDTKQLEEIKKTDKIRLQTGEDVIPTTTLPEDIIDRNVEEEDNEEEDKEYSIWIKSVELKEREKQERIGEKNKRKMEREQKNLKTTAKKQKNAEEKRLDTKQLEEIKKTDKIRLQTGEDVIPTTTLPEDVIDRNFEEEDKEYSIF